MQQLRFMVHAVIPLVTSSAAKICFAFSNSQSICNWCQFALKLMYTAGLYTNDDSSFAFVLGGCFHDLGQEVAHPNIFVLTMIHALVQNLRPKKLRTQVDETIFQDSKRRSLTNFNKRQFSNFQMQRPGTMRTSALASCRRAYVAYHIQSSFLWSLDVYITLCQYTSSCKI